MRPRNISRRVRTGSQVSTRTEPDAAEVELQLAIDPAPLPEGFDPQAWVGAAGAAGRGIVTIRVVDRDEGQQLNQRFRGGEGATNVLAFPADARLCEAELGDLVICLPVVLEEAANQEKTLLAHLAHLVVHGTLHLLGHDHELPAAAREMEAMEVEILGGLGFADPYREDMPDAVLDRGGSHGR